MSSCNMRIIARRTLREFLDSRAGQSDQSALKAALDAWFDEVRKAKWSSAAEVKRLHGTASVVTAERLVFNIKGNDYRPSPRSISKRASSGSSGSGRMRIPT